jgi:L,D-transpeptidase catalytic domain
MIRLPVALLSISIFATLPTVTKNIGNLNGNHTITIDGLENKKKSKNNFTELNSNKFAEWNLDKLGISFTVFNYAAKGLTYLTQHHQLLQQHLITIIDFSKPSTQKRLFIIDIDNGKILFNTLVAHGKNSGKLYATAFSNTESSLESSPGFYITQSTYQGKHGLSLKLQGVEKGINNNALQRAIVMHGADYVTENFIEQNGFLGRSHGCPAIPTNIAPNIINTIKNGSCLFIYAPTKKYLSTSAIINS